MGNFSTCTTVVDIEELFGLRSTKYFRDTFSAEMPMRNHNQSKRFAL